jgi:hypothetical protein
LFNRTTTGRIGSALRIGSVVRAAAKPEAIGPGKARRRRIWLTAEIDGDDVPLARNNIAIKGAEHREYSFQHTATVASRPAATFSGLFDS